MSAWDIEISGRIGKLLKEHNLFAVMLALIIVSQPPYLANLHAVMLLGRDFSMEHFGHLFVENDIHALPGNFGTLDAAVVFALKDYGYPVEEAIPIALAMHAGQLFLSSVAAAWIVVTETTGVRGLTSQITAVLRSRQDS